MSESGEIANISATISGGTDSGDADKKNANEDLANADTNGESAKKGIKNLRSFTDKEVDEMFDRMIRGLDSPDLMRLMDLELEEASRGINSDKLKKELLKRVESEIRDKDFRHDRHRDRDKKRLRKAEQRRNEHKSKGKDHNRGERGSRQLINRRRTPGVNDPEFPYAMTSEKPPKAPENPHTEIKNVDEIFGNILDKWGKTAGEIRKNLDKALKTNGSKVFADIAALVDAHRLDRMLEDEAFQNNPEVHKLKMIVDKVKEAFTDFTRKTDILYRRRDTNQPLVAITTTEKRHKQKAEIGYKKGKPYNTFTPTHMVNALIMLRGKKPEIHDLKTARETLEHAINGTKIEIDPFLADAPDLDDRIAPVNSYLSDMRDTFLEAENAIKDKKLKSKLIETLMKENNITEDQAKKILDETRSVIQRSIAFFDTLQGYEFSQKLVAVQEMSATSE